MRVLPEHGTRAREQARFNQIRREASLDGGREGGEEALRFFTEARSITVGYPG